MVSNSLKPHNFSYEQHFKIRKTALKHFKQDITSKNSSYLWSQDDTIHYHIDERSYESKLYLLKNYEKMLQRRRKEEYLTQFVIICCVFAGLFLVLYFTI